MGEKHAWNFFRSGGFDQVRLDSGADLAALHQLDQKLWVALSCPTRGIEFDAGTLDLIDTDRDGRIRPPEIKAAVAWACACLKNPADLMKHSATLPLDAINDATSEGKPLLASARRILSSLGKPDATSLSADDTSNTARIFANTLFNGDGIVPAEAAEDEATRAAIQDVLACLGGEPDRSGKPGVSQAKVDQFFADAKAYADWRRKAEEDRVILPLGEATLGALDALNAVKAKVEDYFGRCRLAAYDDRAVAALNREEKEYLAIAARDLTITASEVAGFPLARIAADKSLPLQKGVNPAWSDAVAAFRTAVVKPLLGEREALTEADWIAIRGKLAPCEAWLSAKAGGSVEKLGLQRVHELVAGKAREGITALIARDKALEAEANAIGAVDKLVRFHRDLHVLLVNYVSFRDFYGRKEKAIFQAGRLYLDQRSCDLCLTVEDAGKHAAMAGLAGACLIYCDCVRKSSGAKMQIVAAMTDGDADNLMVGRNGIFYDRKGQDWDATIVKIVDNPISLRQAFWSPYKKFVRMIEEQVAKRAGAAEAKSQAQLEATAAAAATADKSKPPELKKFDVGTIAALGVGLGAVATVAGGFVAGFLDLVWWQMPLAVLGLMVVVSTPSVIIAAIKLRKRNLGPILDANGWAVNAKAKINIPFGRSLTRVAALPWGSHLDLIDPYAEKKSGRNAAIAAALVLVVVFALWRFGVVERLAPGLLPKSGWMKARETPPPAAVTPSSGQQGSWMGRFAAWIVQAD
jgi:hypothetical protein